MNESENKGPCCGSGPDSQPTAGCCAPLASSAAAAPLSGITDPPLKETYPQVVSGLIQTSVGDVPQVTTDLTARDRWGTVRVRLNIARMDYRVAPGLYGAGSPTSGSPVFVSANYKLSFDALRRELRGLDGWILVLDTKGINVWCAAGKGTFGTEELVRRIAATRLGEIVTHRKLIVPQLGAPGVAAHDVRRRAGFKVIYGPVRARDIPAFLEAGNVATPDMRRVTFPWFDRLAVVPVELLQWGRYTFLAMAAFTLLAGLGPGGYSVQHAIGGGVRAVLFLLAGYLSGGLLSPLLLPWLPGRAFAEKGAWMGGIVALIALSTGGLVPRGAGGILETVAWSLLIVAISSFMAMNFTGASTYTSLSGVRREMMVSVPLQVSAAAVGAVLWIVQLFVG